MELIKLSLLSLIIQFKSYLYMQVFTLIFPKWDTDTGETLLVTFLSHGNKEKTSKKEQAKEIGRIFKDGSHLSIKCQRIIS